MKPLTSLHKIVLFALALGGLWGCQEGPRGNALANETSPYLLQHAGNPVHWQPYSEGIWEMAREEDKLVLISIGYSSCHWCHVMEEETFEDDSVARLMNDRFISVKVDREERPDVDQVYMTAVQLMTGQGGWPLNVLVLPNGKPLYGGTYHTRKQWMEVLSEMDRLYRENPARAREYADKVAQGVSQANRLGAAADARPVQPAEVAGAMRGWKAQWDLQWGGNQGEQKFMMPAQLQFLMDYAYLARDTAADAHVQKTLTRMALGGVYDQVGGGFYRYSTDAQWRIPHFEKMLYDNAQLLELYARAYKRYKDPAYRETAEGIFTFLQREMKALEGGYFGAMDADSEGEEGKYYLWTLPELQSILGDGYPVFARYYDLRPEVAWEGRYVLSRTQPDMAFAEAESLRPDSLQALKASWQTALLQAREKRVAPGIDQKILTSWNALLVKGMVEAYEAFEVPEYLQAARDLYGELSTLQVARGTLRHTSIGGIAGEEGFLEDYAQLADAGFRLYQATGESEYLQQAESWMEEALERFEADPDTGMFRYTQGEELMAEIYRTDDGVIPSANSVLAGMFLKLGHFYFRETLLERSQGMVLALRERFRQAPMHYCGWGRLMLAYAYPYFEVATVGPEARALHQAFSREFTPNTMRVFSAAESNLPLYANRYDTDGTFIYVCRDHSCRLPVPTAKEALGQIDEDLFIQPEG
ncbi:thioredoxin domain-containing protein [Robiginitalea sp. M366]|uniref:thioredoxin domain-containing protein n=1 Tax=Robiginitalea aestuariiviva TaxID=3036903 RepID=UPI00240D2406|nr:thioredoxin domain-containing protein [Robiginitalea aestuariiviva]MDG1572680.1 thioredoxin domain-containing protein [Robiginitalea aestuariiviva]